MRIGIDFGSTYSMFSVYNSTLDQVEVLTPVEGEPPSIPSVVSVSMRNGKASYGAAAKGQAGKRNVRMFEAFKMLLTATDPQLLAQRGYDEEYTPRRVSRDFLASMLSGILDRSNEDSIEKICVCVPEIWGKSLTTLDGLDGRSILREILKHEVDVPVGDVQVVTEPEAASAYFAYNYEQETGKSFNGHLLLIDYGGGTLDITLTEVFTTGPGAMEIGYRAGGGAGENHPGSDGSVRVGSAGIAYMQDVVLRALRESGLLAPEEEPPYTSPDFVAAVQDFERQLKSAERIAEIEDTFDSFGAYYSDMASILEEPPIEFIDLEYDGEDVVVTYQQLYESYRQVIEGVVAEQLEEINEKVRKHIGKDPCDPRAGNQDDFKIALVGGFGSFYLVKKQIADIYHLDPNEGIDHRTQNITASKREQAISLGAALIAAGKIVLQKIARYSIGLYLVSSGGARRLAYGIKFNQIVELNKPYFLLKSENGEDSPRREIIGSLRTNITNFAIEFSDRRNHGGLMALKPEMLARLEQLPETGFWNCGFSMDESDVISFHIVPHVLPYLGKRSEGLVIPLESYSKMFDLTAVTEVET